MSRLAVAVVRGAVVILAVTLPVLLLPPAPAAAFAGMLFPVLALGLLVMLDYAASSPALIGFRAAPPFNRLRLLAVATLLLALSVVWQGADAPGPLTLALLRFGAQFSGFAEAFLAPARGLGLVSATGSLAGIAAGLSLGLSLLVLAFGAGLILLSTWPRQAGADPWRNLPALAPSSGRTLGRTLREAARVNVALAIFLPFLLPVAAVLTGRFVGLAGPLPPLVMVWSLTAWFLIPALLAVRALALWRLSRRPGRLSAGSGQGLSLSRD